MPKKSSKKQSKDIFMPAEANPSFERQKKSKFIARTNQEKGKKIKNALKK